MNNHSQREMKKDAGGFTSNEVLNSGSDKSLPSNPADVNNCIFCNEPIHIDNWAGVNKQSMFCNKITCLMELAKQLDSQQDTYIATTKSPSGVMRGKESTNRLQQMGEEPADNIHNDTEFKQNSPHTKSLSQTEDGDIPNSYPEKSVGSDRVKNGENTQSKQKENKQ